MGKSNEKSYTKAVAALATGIKPFLRCLSVSAGKRGAEKALEKAVSAKKQKVENDAALASKKKTEKKKPPPPESDSKSSYAVDDSSSEDEKPTDNKAQIPAKNGKVVNKESSSSHDSSESDSDEDSDDKPAPAKPSAKKNQADSSSDDTSDNSEVEPSKNVAEKDSSDNESDEEDTDEDKSDEDDSDKPLNTPKKKDADVEMVDTEETQKTALELHEQPLLGCRVGLDRYLFTPESRDILSYEKEGIGQADSYAVVVKGFDTSLGKDKIKSALEDHFGSCGEIASVNPSGFGKW